MTGIYLHVGLHKTGTSYLQKAVWPRWSGIYYTGRKTGAKPPRDELIMRAKEMPVLLSSESQSGSLKRIYRDGGRWLDGSIKSIDALRSWKASGVPVHAVVTLRRHDRWALSIYKHYLKYGGVDGVETFFGVGGRGTATLSLDDLYVLPRLKALEAALSERPFCFFLEEVSERPEALGEELAAFVGCPQGPVFPDERYNEGMNLWQARVSRAVSALVFNRGCRGRGRLRRRHFGGFLAARNLDRARLLPRKSPLVLPDRVRTAVRDACARDLDAVQDYVFAGRRDGADIRRIVGQMR